MSKNPKARFQPLPAGGEREGERERQRVRGPGLPAPNRHHKPALQGSLQGHRSSLAPHTSARRGMRVKGRRGVRLHSILRRPVPGWCLIPSPFHPEPTDLLASSCPREQRSADVRGDGLLGPVHAEPNGSGLVEMVGGQGRSQGCPGELGNAQQPGGAFPQGPLSWGRRAKKVQA